LRMDVRERIRDAGDERYRFRYVERLSLEALGEILAVDPLHHQERRTVVGPPVLHVPHDARMVERGEHARLATEAVERVAVVRVVHDLDRDGRARVAVGRAIHGAHAALTGEPLDDPPIRDQPTEEIRRTHQLEAITAAVRSDDGRSLQLQRAAFPVRDDVDSVVP